MIRKAVLQDALRIAELERNNIECPWSLINIEESILNENYYFCTSVQKEKVIGYGAVNIIIDEAEICNIAVDKVYRNCGHGTEIVNGLVYYCQKMKVKKIFLEVNEHNVNAINLYLKSGFKQFNKRERYYGDDSAILMQKDI